MKNLSGIIPALGSHDFAGEWAPGSYHHGNNGTFSVAVFQWQAKRDGTLKRGRCIVRVKGYPRNPEAVYCKARELCRHLDAGGAVVQKSITVSP